FYYSSLTNLIYLTFPTRRSSDLALLIETMQNYGADSFPALLAATVQGSTETTFYVLAVYFGAVGIRRARHAVGCALVADFAGIRSEEHTSELQSRFDLVCRLLLE